MGLGVGLGYFIPSVANFINFFSVGTTSIPIAIGLPVSRCPALDNAGNKQLVPPDAGGLQGFVQVPARPPDKGSALFFFFGPGILPDE